MIAVDFKGSNQVLRCPETMPNCVDLPCFIGLSPDPEPQPIFLTAWRPSVEDLAALNAGRELYLQTYGTVFAPALMYTLDENGTPNMQD